MCGLVNPVAESNVFKTPVEGSGRKEDRGYNVLVVLR